MQAGGRRGGGDKEQKKRWGVGYLQPRGVGGQHLHHESLARSNIVRLRLARAVPRVLARQLHLVFAPLLLKALSLCLKLPEQLSVLDSPHLDYVVCVQRDARFLLVRPPPVEEGSRHHLVVAPFWLHVDDGHVGNLVAPALAHRFVYVPAPHGRGPVGASDTGSHVFKVDEAFELLVLPHREPRAPHPRPPQSVPEAPLYLPALCHVKGHIRPVSRAPLPHIQLPRKLDNFVLVKLRPLVARTCC